MEERVYGALLAVAARLGASVDPLLSCLTRAADGTARVTVTLAALPPGVVDLPLFESAFAAEVLEEVGEEGVGVVVRVPDAVAMPPPPPSGSPQKWIHGQVCGVREWYFLSLQNLADAAYRHAVASLPWRDALAMEERVPALVERAIALVRSGQRSEILDGRVDSLLPALESVLPESADRAEVERDCRWPGPTTLLDTYEAIHDLVDRDLPRSEATSRAFGVVFVKQTRLRRHGGGGAVSVGGGEGM